MSWRFAEALEHQKLVLEGGIDEESDFAPILGQVSGPLLAIDFAGIKRINSCGVREWIEFVVSLNQAGVTLILERCPALVVTQVSLISNFAGRGGKIRSILAPYYCAACDLEELSFVDFGSDEVKIEEYIDCPHCDEKMEFDDMIDVYLQCNAGT